MDLTCALSHGTGRAWSAIWLNKHCFFDLLSFFHHSALERWSGLTDVVSLFSLGQGLCPLGLGLRRVLHRSSRSLRVMQPHQPPVGPLSVSETVRLEEQPRNWGIRRPALMLGLPSSSSVTHPRWTSVPSPAHWRGWLRSAEGSKMLDFHGDAARPFHQSEDHSGRWPGPFGDATHRSPWLHYAFRSVPTWRIIILTCHASPSRFCVPASRGSLRDGIPLSPPSFSLGTTCLPD